MLQKLFSNINFTKYRCVTYKFNNVVKNFNNVVWCIIASAQSNFQIESTFFMPEKAANSP